MVYFVKDLHLKVKQLSHSSFSVNLWSALLKIGIWKSPDHSHECYHLVSGSLRLWPHQQGWYVKHKCQIHYEPRFSVLHFKKPTHMAAPWGAQIQSEKKQEKNFCSMSVKHTKPANEKSCTFPTCQANLHLCMDAPSKNKKQKQTKLFVTQLKKSQEVLLLTSLVPYCFTKLVQEACSSNTH